MGRFAAYLGPRAPLAPLLEGGDRGLVGQARSEPRGFGVAWFPDDGEPAPAHLRSDRALVAGHPYLALLRRLRAEAAVAALGDGPSQPLVHGRHLLAVDGALGRLEGALARRLRERLGDAGHAAAEGLGPAGLVLGAFVDALADGEGPDAIAGALERTVEAIQSLGGSAPASLSLVVTDGRCLVTLRTSTDGPSPPLHTAVVGPGGPLPASGRVVASQPLFEGDWLELEPHSLVIFTVEPEGAPGDPAR
jgi:predicted glutamine amidotransferase